MSQRIKLIFQLKIIRLLKKHLLQRIFLNWFNCFSCRFIENWIRIKRLQKQIFQLKRFRLIIIRFRYRLRIQRKIIIIHLRRIILKSRKIKPLLSMELIRQRNWTLHLLRKWIITPLISPLLNQLSFRIKKKRFPISLPRSLTYFGIQKSLPHSLPLRLEKNWIRLQSCFYPLS